MCVACDIVKRNKAKDSKLYRPSLGDLIPCERSPLYLEYVVIACGRCAECVKRKRNSIGYCLEQEFKRSDSCCFVTFTYDEQNVPITARRIKVDSDTGEIFDYSTFWHLDRDDDGYVRSGIHGLYSRYNSKPRYYNVEIPMFDNSEVHKLVYTPSLCRKDFSSFIKVVRESYKQSFGERLKFKYWCIGEYGPKTCRPHFHAIFYNVSKDDFYKFFRRFWKFGNLIIEPVEKVYKKKNGEIVDGFVHLGRYLGKYMSKGVFECESVKYGYAEKPRIVSSLNVGNNVSSFLSDWLHCFDMFGRYDPNSLKLDAGVYLSESQIRSIAKEYSNRLYYYSNGYKFALPRSIVNKVRYNKNYITHNPVTNEEFKKPKLFSKSLKKIFEKCSEITQMDALRRVNKEFWESCKKDSDGLPLNDGSRFWLRQEARRAESLKILSVSDTAFYAVSKC